MQRPGCPRAAEMKTPWLTTSRDRVSRSVKGTRKCRARFLHLLATLTRIHLNDRLNRFSREWICGKPTAILIMAATWHGRHAKAWTTYRFLVVSGVCSPAFRLSLAIMRIAGAVPGRIRSENLRFTPLVAGLSVRYRHGLAALPVPVDGATF